MTLKAGIFIRRFLIHAIPERFHRIRHFRILANSNPAKAVWAVPGAVRLPKAENGKPDPDEKAEEEWLYCPECGSLSLYIVYLPCPETGPLMKSSPAEGSKARLAEPRDDLLS